MNIYEDVYKCIIVKVTSQTRLALVLWVAPLNARLGFLFEAQFKGNRGRGAGCVAINNWNGGLRYSWVPFSIIYWSITSYNEKGTCYQKKSRTLTPANPPAGGDVRVKYGRKCVPAVLPISWVHAQYLQTFPENAKLLFFSLLNVWVYFSKWKRVPQNSHDRAILLDNRAQIRQSATPSKGTFCGSSTDNGRPWAAPRVNFWW